MLPHTTYAAQYPVDDDHPGAMHTLEMAQLLGDEETGNAATRAPCAYGYYDTDEMDYAAYLDEHDRAPPGVPSTNNIPKIFSIISNVFSVFPGVSSGQDAFANGGKMRI